MTSKKQKLEQHSFLLLSLVESGAVVKFDTVLLVGNNGEVIVGVPSVEAQR